MFQPPTDNLYKFLAIFGLVLFGFSCYVPLQRLDEHAREVAKWNAAWGPILVRAQETSEVSRAELECAIEEASGHATAAARKLCSELESRRE
jgi:hypothetical protein